MTIDPRDIRLKSQYYTPAQLMSLRRIAELSALLEVELRNVLALAMGIGANASEALFLGDRASNLVTRIRELGKFADAPRWFADEAVDWATRVGHAIEKRDDLLHRAPIMLVINDNDDPDDQVLGWNRARRKHTAVPVDNSRLLDVVTLLSDLDGEVSHKLFWGSWETSFDDVRRTATSED